MPTRRTVRPAPASPGSTEQSTRSASRSRARGARSAAAGTMPGAQQTTAGVAPPGVVGGARRGGAAAQAQAPAVAAPGGVNNIPAESAEARAQAERDRTGKTRPGYVRRDLASTATFNDVTYQAGANREVPQNFADHLDLTTVAPDSSTEVNRKTKFGGGKEDDQKSQGAEIKKLREGAPAAQRKHRESDAFAPIAGQRKSGAKK